VATISATPTLDNARARVAGSALTFNDAMRLLSREERFMATVQAMNTLLIQKGVYTTEELERYYCQWAEAQIQKPKRDRPGWRPRFLAWLF
jgi:hypothetical protein